jgi:hypothetical protein
MPKKTKSTKTKKGASLKGAPKETGRERRASKKRKRDSIDEVPEPVKIEEEGPDDIPISPSSSDSETEAHEETKKNEAKPKSVLSEFDPRKLLSNAPSNMRKEHRGHPLNSSFYFKINQSMDAKIMAMVKKDLLKPKGNREMSIFGRGPTESLTKMQAMMQPDGYKYGQDNKTAGGKYGHLFHNFEKLGPPHAISGFYGLAYTYVAMADKPDSWVKDRKELPVVWINEQVREIMISKIEAHFGKGSKEVVIPLKILDTMWNFLKTIPGLVSAPLCSLHNLSRYELTCMKSRSTNSQKPNCCPAHMQIRPQDTAPKDVKAEGTQAPSTNAPTASRPKKEGGFIKQMAMRQNAISEILIRMIEDPENTDHPELKMLQESVSEFSKKLKKEK